MPQLSTQVFYSSPKHTVSSVPMFSRHAESTGENNQHGAPLAYYDVPGVTCDMQTINSQFNVFRSELRDAISRQNISMICNVADRMQAVYELSFGYKNSEIELIRSGDIKAARDYVNLRASRDEVGML